MFLHKLWLNQPIKAQTETNVAECHRPAPPSRDAPLSSAWGSGLAAGQHWGGTVPWVGAQLKTALLPVKGQGWPHQTPASPKKLKRPSKRDGRKTASRFSGGTKRRAHGWLWSWLGLLGGRYRSSITSYDLTHAKPFIPSTARCLAKMGSVEDKQEGQKALHSLRSSWCPAWHSPLCYEKEQGKVHQKCKASTQENRAVPCVPDPGNTTHKPEENEERTRSACVSTHTYVHVVHTHTCFMSSNSASLLVLHRACSNSQKHTETGSAP